MKDRQKQKTDNYQILGCRRSWNPKELMRNGYNGLNQLGFLMVRLREKKDLEREDRPQVWWCDGIVVPTADICKVNQQSNKKLGFQ